MDLREPKMHSHDVKLSKMLSWLLRHGANKEGLSFDDGGFIYVQQILNLKQFKNYCIADIMRVVEENDKKRFTLRYKSNAIDSLQIRANQGHSLPVAEDGLLTLLTEDKVPPVIYHGTYSANVNDIKRKGLNRMNRNHIHFTSKLPGENDVSGMRKNCDVCIVVDARRALKDGFKFFLSDNAVILCPGNEQGVIPASYFNEILHLPSLNKF